MIVIYKETIWTKRDVERYGITSLTEDYWLTNNRYADVRGASLFISFSGVTDWGLFRRVRQNGIPVVFIGGQKIPYRANWKTRMRTTTESILNRVKGFPDPIPLKYGDALRQPNPQAGNNGPWVFIDQAFGHNPESMAMNIDIPNRQRYEMHVAGFLKNFPEVIVAGHPLNAATHFWNKTIIRGKTLDLIEQSKGVIGHCSTTIAWAVWCGKPVVLLTTPDLRKSIYQMYIEGISDALEIPIHNPEDAITVKEIPEETRQWYVEESYDLKAPVLQEIIDKYRRKE